MVYFSNAVLYLAVLVEGCAVLVILVAVLQAIIQAVQLIPRAAFAAEDMLVVRVVMGRWLSLALEFLLAADILRTAVAPTWEEIGKLAAIALLRTFLNHFLEKEIQHTNTPPLPH